MFKSVLSKIPCRKDFVKGRNTVEIGYPWQTIGSIIATELFLRPEFEVFECGCGGSTVFYSKICKHVYSIDSNEQWIKKVSSLKLENVDLKYLKNTNEFVKEINSLQDFFYDVISIDSDPKTTNRLELIKNSIQKIKNGGYLILDNYNSFGVEKFICSENFIEYTFDDPSWNGKGTKIVRVWR